MLIYRLDKEKKKIDEIDKDKLWKHLSYYYNLSRWDKKAINNILNNGKAYNTLIYIFAEKKRLLEKIL